MEEDFGKLLAENLKDPEMQKMMEEKAEAGEGPRQSVGEIVKDYPGPQRELDLHGFTGPEAMNELENFIDRSIRHQVRTVRIITGKGLHSKYMKSVLPEKTEGKLSELRRRGIVFAFRREKSRGSFIVYLVS